MPGMRALNRSTKQKFLNAQSAAICIGFLWPLNGVLGVRLMAEQECTNNTNPDHGSNVDINSTSQQKFIIDISHSSPVEQRREKRRERYT
jgi:hypothetical protein